MINVFEVCLELFGGSKLGFGLDDLEIRIEYCLVCCVELLLSLANAGDDGIISCLGVVNSLLGCGVALECLVRCVERGLRGRDLALGVGQSLLLVGDFLLSICEGRCGSGLCSLGTLHLSLSGGVGLLGVIKRILLARKIRLCGIALGGEVLDRSGCIVIGLVGLVGLRLGGIERSLRLGLASSSPLRLLLAF
ncbi:unknown [Collinsella sp. CAG:289]|nr:unknown [Collinsella sp. CAG:289]